MAGALHRGLVVNDALRGRRRRGHPERAERRKTAVRGRRTHRPNCQQHDGREYARQSQDAHENPPAAYELRSGLI